MLNFDYNEARTHVSSYRNFSGKLWSKLLCIFMNFCEDLWLKLV